MSQTSGVEAGLSRPHNLKADAFLKGGATLLLESYTQIKAVAATL